MGGRGVEGSDQGQSRPVQADGQGARENSEGGADDAGHQSARACDLCRGDDRCVHGLRRRCVR